jgi:hypothetical protein
MNPRRPHSLGLLLALLALVLQINIGAPPPKTAADAVLTAAKLCRADDNGAPPAAPHTHDCVLCPLCLTGANATLALPADAPALAPPRIAALHQPGIPPQTATAPPAARFAQSRAPPIQT